MQFFLTKTVALVLAATSALAIPSEMASTAAQLDKRAGVAFRQTRGDAPKAGEVGVEICRASIPASESPCSFANVPAHKVGQTERFGNTCIPIEQTFRDDLSVVSAFDGRKCTAFYMRDCFSYGVGMEFDFTDRKSFVKGFNDRKARFNWKTVWAFSCESPDVK